MDVSTESDEILGEHSGSPTEFDCAAICVSKMLITVHELALTRDLCREHKFTEALAICEGFIAENPEDSRGFTFRAFARISKGDDEGGFADFGRAIERAPTNPMTYIDRAMMSVWFERWALAISDFTRAFELDQKHMSPLFLLFRAECYYRVSDFEKSLADCERIPDDFVFPGPRQKDDCSKHDIIADIRAAQLANQSLP